MTLKEIFKPISHHQDYYISNYGRVYSLISCKFLTATEHTKNKGVSATYKRIELKNPRRKYLVHRLVAEAFLDNPEKYPIINHKDENGENNHISNIEWCDNMYNCTYSQGSKVRQLTREGVYITSFNSISDAARNTGSDFRLISAVCVGKRKTHNNFKWEYEKH